MVLKKIFEIFLKKDMTGNMVCQLRSKLLLYSTVHDALKRRYTKKNTRKKSFRKILKCLKES